MAVETRQGKKKHTEASAGQILDDLNKFKIDQIGSTDHDQLRSSSQSKRSIACSNLRQFRKLMDIRIQKLKRLTYFQKFPAAASGRDISSPSFRFKTT